VLKGNQVVLSVGGNAELLWLREHVLKAAGFEVVSTTSESKAVAEMQQGKCAVLLLCHSLPDAVRSTVSKQFRQHCPHAPILGITNVRWPQALDEVDSYVYGLEGPEVLIAAVRSAAAERSDAA
jgi:DNA-binding NarL/FixJ family response regulator